MTGSLIVSLDFALIWGVCDPRSVQGYCHAALGGRKAIPASRSRLIYMKVSASGMPLTSVARSGWVDETVSVILAKDDPQPAVTGRYHSIKKLIPWAIPKRLLSRNKQT